MGTPAPELDEGFQRAEFLLEKGFLDAVVHRKDLKTYLIRALDFLKTSAAA
jgi:acetyl-CoA carboxylase carboxyl transferase subunit beta